MGIVVEYPVSHSEKQPGTYTHKNMKWLLLDSWGISFLSYSAMAVACTTSIKGKAKNGKRLCRQGNRRREVMEMWQWLQKNHPIAYEVIWSAVAAMGIASIVISIICIAGRG